MFGTLGGPEVVLILVVALIVFGPRKLPEIGKTAGKMLAEFRKASHDFRRTIEDEVEAEKVRDKPAPVPAALAEPDPAPAPAEAAPVVVAAEGAVQRGAAGEPVAGPEGTPATPPEPVEPR